MSASVGRPSKDWTGQKVNTFTIIQKSTRKDFRRSNIFWECKGECGHTQIFSSKRLGVGNIECGYCKTERLSPKKKTQKASDVELTKDYSEFLYEAEKLNEELTNRGITNLRVEVSPRGFQWYSRHKNGRSFYRISPERLKELLDRNGLGNLLERATRKKEGYHVIEGKKFGKLSVISRIRKMVYGHILYRCRCDCGEELERTDALLKRSKEGSTSLMCYSCGKVVKAHNKERNDQRIRRTVGSKLWSSIKRSAADRGIPIELDREYLNELFESQQGRCRISGQEICFTTGSWPQTASLDRKNSSMGYIRGNVQWVHKDVNMLKGSLTDERLIEICTIIAKYNDNRVGA